MIKFLIQFSIIIFGILFSQYVCADITGYKIEPHKWKFDGESEGYKIVIDYQWVSGEYHILQLKNDQDLNWTILKVQTETWMPNDGDVAREDRPQLIAWRYGKSNWLEINGVQNPKIGLTLEDIKPNGKINIYLYPLKDFIPPIKNLEDIFIIHSITSNNTPEEIRIIKNNCQTISILSVDSKFEQISGYSERGVKINKLLSFDCLLLPIEYTDKIQNSGTIHVHLNKTISKYYTLHGVKLWHLSYNTNIRNEDDKTIQDENTYRLKSLFRLNEKNKLQIILEPKIDMDQLSPWFEENQLSGLIKDSPNKSIFVRLKLE